MILDTITISDNVGWIWYNFQFYFKNFHFILFISPSPVCFYNCGTVGSIRPTFPLISIFGQKLYTRCLFSCSSPGRRLLYYFPVFRTQFFITCSPPNISDIKEDGCNLELNVYLTFPMNGVYVPMYYVAGLRTERFISMDGDESGDQFVDTEERGERRG